MPDLPNVELRSYDPIGRRCSLKSFPGSRLEPALIAQLRGDGDPCAIVNHFKAEFEQQGIDQNDLSLLEHAVLLAPWINRWLTEEDYYEGSSAWKQLHRYRNLLRQHGFVSDEQINSPDDLK